MDIKFTFHIFSYLFGLRWFATKCYRGDVPGAFGMSGVDVVVVCFAPPTRTPWRRVPCKMLWTNGDGLSLGWTTLLLTIEYIIP